MQTGRDSFLLGPSGYGYLHPSIIDPTDPVLEDFVLRTTAAADLLSASAYVHWDDPSSPYSNSNLTSTVTTATGDWSENMQLQQYIGQFDGSSITAVFSPVAPSGSVNSLVTFREVYRWSGDDPVSNVASVLGALQNGTMGYLYLLPDVAMAEVEALARALPGHVRLVGYRELSALQHARLGQTSRSATLSASAIAAIFVGAVLVVAICCFGAVILVRHWRAKEARQSINMVPMRTAGMEQTSSDSPSDDVQRQ